MPDEDVQLVEGHPFDQLLDFGNALEVPARIEHQRTPCETRMIDDRARRDFRCRTALPAGLRQQLKCRRAAVKNAFRRARGDNHGAIAHDDAITRIALNIGSRIDFENDRRLCIGSFRYMQLKSARLGNPFHEMLGDTRDLFTVCAAQVDGSTVRDLDRMAAQELRFKWLRCKRPRSGSMRNGNRRQTQHDAHAVTQHGRRALHSDAPFATKARRRYQ